MAGRYQKPGSVNRNAKMSWTTLPAEGRKGPTPKLPARAPGGDAWSKTTREWWRRLWRKPQATRWDEDDAELFRLAGFQERFWAGAATSSEIVEMRQIEDRHGLNPKAMLQLCWMIADDELAEAREQRKPSTRERPKIVDPALIVAR